jgi:DNA-binding NarL/FixJ family response regulator
MRVLLAGRSRRALRRIRAVLGRMDTVLVAGEATTGKGMVRTARRTLPGVIVIRSTLRHRELLPEVSRIRSERPDVQMVAVTGDDPKVFLRVARAYGVSYCVPEDLVERRLPSLVHLADRDHREAAAKLRSIGWRPVTRRHS